MTDSNYIVVMGQISDIWRRLDALEGARPKAESDAAACSPAVEPKSLPRSPDREALSKLRSFIVIQLRLLKSSGETGFCKLTQVRLLESILQQVMDFDQGDEHKSRPTVQHGIETSPVKQGESEE